MFRKRLIGKSRKGRSTLWELTCDHCAHSWEVTMSALHKQHQSCGNCGKTQLVDFSAPSRRT